MPAQGIPVIVSGIRLRRAFGEYDGCSSLYIAVLSRHFATASVVSRVSCINLLFHSRAGPQAPFRQQPCCPGENYVLVITRDLRRSSSGAISVVIVCVASTTLPPGGSQDAREAI